MKHNGGFPSHQASLTISAGYFQGKFSPLNDQMKLWGMNTGFPSYFRTVGLNFSGPTGGRYGEYGEGSFNLEYIIPQKINQGDSLAFTLSGLHFISSIFGFDLIKNNDAIAFIVAPGIDWGKLWLNRKMEGPASDFSNFYIAPLVRAEFRVIVWKIALGARLTYRYDISKPQWKMGSAPALPGTKFSGLGFQVFIGWGKNSS